MHVTPPVEAVKNLVRGNVARRRSRAYHSNDIAATSSFRTSLRQSLLTARLRIGPDEYEEFLAWMKGILKQELGSESDLGFGFDYLNGVINSKSAKLTKEISWIAARIRAEAAEINKFRAELEYAENHFVRDDISGALEALSSISNRFGETMWCVQLSLALHHRLGGLEAQKAYLEQVKSQHRRGLLSYIAFHTSVRNEERTTWTRFRSNILNSSRKRRDKALSRYINYRLLSEWPRTESGLSDVLRLEQSCSIFDVYETFIKFSQHIISSNPNGELSQYVISVLKNLSPIKDYRINKMLGASGADELSSARGLIARGDHKQAYRELMRLPAHSSSAWVAIYLSSLRANREKTTRGNALQDALDDAFRGGSFGVEGFDNLAKTGLNFGNFDIGRSVYDALVSTFSLEDRPSLEFKAVGFSNRTHVKEDAFGIKPIYEEFSRHQPIYRAMYEAILRYEAGDYHGASQAIDGAEFSDLITKNLAAIINVHSLDACGDLNALTRLISQIGCINPSSISLSLLSKIAGGYQPNSFRALPAEVATLNALNLLWKASDIDHIGSTLKMLTGRFLRSPSVGAPSGIDPGLIDCSGIEFVYFLREVCVPSVLDVSRVFSSSKSVSEERQKICGLLNELDPDRSEEYSAEVSAITRRLKVDEGLQIIDQSRVYVDTDALIRWAVKNISEDYGRYTDLIAAGVGSTANFDDTLKELRDIQSKVQAGELITPDNEADNILASILIKLRDEFLNSSIFGLDYFLSQRIRHVSFIGLLRGPLEFLDLISNRATAQSEYSSNASLLDQVNYLAKNEIDHIDAAFKSFSANVDASISKVKNVSLQIRNDEKSDGLFYITIDATVLMLSRAMFSEARSLSDFIDSACVIFWAILNEPLKRVRHRIEVILKEDLALHFDQLRDHLKVYELRSPEISKKLENLALAERQVNEALREASSWFTRPELREVNKTFTLEEALAVAIESAQKLHANFTPKITSKVSEDINLRSPDLVFITDAVLVAFSNIKAYSKMSEPAVEITIDVSRANESISVEVINECASQVRSSAHDRKMDAIRDALDKRDFGKKPRTEGGSGFLKLAAIAYQSDKGKVEFGFIDKGRFRMSVTYSFIFDTTDAAA